MPILTDWEVKLLLLINQYLVTLKVYELSHQDFREILDKYSVGGTENLVAAIKMLREKVCVDDRYYTLREGSTFASWLKNENLTVYQHGATLGLKEAKDIIDFIRDNW